MVTVLNKHLALMLLTMLAVSNLILIESAFAQSIPKPSVPEFTVSQVDRSYDVPVTTTYSTDPFTGQQVTHTIGGYHVVNKTIDVFIKNQHSYPIDLGNGSLIQLYYSVRTKGHFGDWSITSPNNGYSSKVILSSTSEYTVVTLILSSLENDGYYIPDRAQADLDLPDGGQEDFQVKAQAGYPYFGGHIMPIGTEFRTIEESDWSDTQTITIGQSTSKVIHSTPPVQNSTTSMPIQHIPENTGLHGLSWGEITVLVLMSTIAVLLVTLTIFLQKRRTRKI